jgi:G3E family GTPase
LSICIDVISGFLGAGKTTFLKKVIPAMEGKVALIENEFDNPCNGRGLCGKCKVRLIQGSLSAMSETERKF